MKIVVPIDFTQITENALKYAIGLTDILSVTEIVLYHVVSSDKETSMAMSNLNALAEKHKPDTTAKIESLVTPGNIFDMIGKTSAEIGGNLIIMGTHGIKGMQHIIGSRAMRVITHSELPYIVVQKKPYWPVKNILVPVDYTKEVKQLLPLLETLNEKFKAKLHLIRQQTKDEFINDKIRNNMVYFKSYLTQSNISFVESPSYFTSAKHKDVMQEAAAINADLIVTTIDPETDITDYIMGVEEQKIVANELQIPVLCINIKHFVNRKGNVFEYTF